MWPTLPMAEWTRPRLSSSPDTSGTRSGAGHHSGPVHGPEATNVLRVGSSAEEIRQATLRRLRVRFFNPPGLTKRGYSHVAVVTGGKTIYIAGQVGLNSAGELVGRGAFRDETFRLVLFSKPPTTFPPASRAARDRLRLGRDTLDRPLSMRPSSTCRSLSSSVYPDLATPAGRPPS